MRRPTRWSPIVIPAAAALILTTTSGSLIGAAKSGAVRPTPRTTLRTTRWAGPLGAYQPLGGSVVAVAPRDGTFGNVDYNGGAVMPSSTDYLVFWSPKGLGAYGSGKVPEYVSGLEQYIKDLAHDSGLHTNTDSVATQYNDLTGAFVKYSVTFGGGILDTDAYPKSECPVNSPVIECVTDGQIQTELERFVSAHHLKTDLTHEYFLLTPPHVEGCFNNNPKDSYGGCSAGERPLSLSGYCAYHSATTRSPLLIYAVDPYVTGINGCDDGNHPNGPSDGAIEGGLSHEHSESITDPLANDAWTNGAGTNHGDEIGDQCDTAMGKTLGKAPNGAKYNQKINGHFYWYQEEWSDQGHTCLQRFTLSGVEPTAKFTVTSAAGLALTFNAAGSTAPGGVAHYVWQFNDKFGASTVEVSTPSVTHTFPAAGSYSVGLTIYGSSGVARGTGAIVTTSHSGFTPGFTISPSKPVHGKAVTFTGLTTVSAKPVQVYFWEFGDGTIGSGQKPVHTYAKAGSYRVTLVMYSGVGSAFPGAGAAPVTVQKVTVS